MFEMKDTFHERVDKMLAGTMLGGKEESESRLTLFSFWLGEDNGLKNMFGKESKEYMTCKLIAGISYAKSAEEPYKQVLASDVIEYLERYDGDRLRQNIQGHIDRMDGKDAELLGGFMKNVLQSDKLSSYRDTAIALLEAEREREEEIVRTEEKYGQKGDFIDGYRISVRGGYDNERQFVWELGRLLPHDGWELRRPTDGISANSLVRGKSSVYLHPLEFVITARKDEVKELVSYIGKLEPQYFGIVSLEENPGEVLKDMTAREAYDSYMRNIKGIRDDILSNADGRKSAFDIIQVVRDKNRIGNVTERKMMQYKICQCVVEDEFGRLVDRKRIVVDEKGKARLVDDRPKLTKPNRVAVRDGKEGNER